MRWWGRGRAALEFQVLLSGCNPKGSWGGGLLTPTSPSYELGCQWDTVGWGAGIKRDPWLPMAEGMSAMVGPCPRV